MSMYLMRPLEKIAEELRILNAELKKIRKLLEKKTK